MHNIISILYILFQLFSHPSYANISEWRYNPNTEYDKYYDNNSNSIYNKIYNNEYTIYDKFLIERLINEQAKNNQVVRILDFGAGNGRHFPIYMNIAKELAKTNKKIELIAYDPSKNAFLQYNSILANNGFQDLNIKSNSQYFNQKSMILDNFMVTLIQPYNIDNIIYFENVINKVDITMCFFGVISHIQKKSERVNTIKILSKITNSKLYIQYPSYRILKEERAAFELLRKNNYIIKINNQNINFEKGDLIYARNLNGEHVENFYHLYENIDEIRDELRLASLTPSAIEINKILHETTLIKNKSLGYFDYFISHYLAKIMPEYLINMIAGYYAVEINTN